MSKKAVIIIAVVCVAAGLGIGLLLKRSGPLKIDITRPNASSTQANADMPPQAAGRSYTEETLAYSIDIEYPELQGLANAGVQDKVNNRIKAGVFDHIASFKTEAPSDPEDLQSADLRSMLGASYSVELLTKSFFSGLLAYSNYSAGAAHPNNYLVALNYDLKTGNAVTLDPFLKQFNPASGYFGRLADHVMDELIKKLGDDADSVGAIREGAAATPDNYQNFTLSAEGLTIHFDPYQVAAYAVGSPSVTIPYDVLVTKILKAPSAGSGTAGASAQWWLQ